MIRMLSVGMWMMLQADKPDDFVLATNETHPVREFVERAFACVGITVEWKGERGTVDEIGVDANDHSRVLVRVDPKYFRPTEVDILIGNAAKAERTLVSTVSVSAALAIVPYCYQTIVSYIYVILTM